MFIDLNDNDIIGDKTSSPPTTTRRLNPAQTSSNVWHRVEKNSTVRTEIKLIYKEVDKAPKSTLAPCTRPLRAVFYSKKTN